MRARFTYLRVPLQSRETVMTLRKSAFAAVCLLIVVASSAAAGQSKFYQYYSDGLDYVEKKDWLRAIQEFRSAMSLEFEDRQTLSPSP